MNFDHTDDRRMLADTLGRFVADRVVPFDRAKAATSVPGYDPALLAQLADLGALGALFSVEQGGYGGDGFDVMVVFEAIGRGLVAGPFLPALMSGRALALGGGRDAEIAGLIAGEKVIAFAHQETEAGYDLDHVAATAQASDGGWILNGTKSVIRDAEGSSHLLVSARTSGVTGDTAGISLFLLPSDAPGLTIRGYPCIDGGRAAEVRLEQVELPASALVAAEGQAAPIIAAATAAGIVALTAEALGAMQVVRDLTLDYLRTRVQFGAPIGKNQALQHRMATMLLEIEQAQSAVINVAAALDAPAAERDRAASAAKYTIGKTGTYVAEEAIQLHGGIGMTWELAMSHYAKRLLMIDHQLGDEDHHLVRFVQLGRAA